MKKRYIKRLFIVLGGIAFSYILYSNIYGNPLLKYHFKQEVKEYLKEEYPDGEFILDRISYSFKLSTLEHTYFAIGARQINEDRVIRFWTKDGILNHKILEE